MINSMNGSSRIQPVIHCLINPDMLQLSKVLKSTADLNIDKFSGYVQDNIRFGDSFNAYTFTAGVRFNYNSLNKELLISPRIGASWKPNWKRDIIFRVAAGAYHQPPFIVS